MSQPGEFTVDPAQVRASGVELGKVDAELRAMLDALRTEAAGAGAAAGTPRDAAAVAYTDMWQRWDRQVTTIAAAFGDLGGRFVRSAGGYQAADDGARR